MQQKVAFFIGIVMLIASGFVLRSSFVLTGNVSGDVKGALTRPNDQPIERPALPVCSEPSCLNCSNFCTLCLCQNGQNPFACESVCAIFPSSSSSSSSSETDCGGSYGTCGGMCPDATQACVWNSLQRSCECVSS